MDTDKIEQKLNLVEQGATPVETFGGLSPRDIHGTIEIAKFLAESDIAVPEAFRKKGGACWRVVMQALDWGMPIYALMDSAYIIKDKVSYESKVLQALIEKSGKLSKKLRAEYIGEGNDRQCKVIGFFKNETEACEWTSPKLGDIQPKNSPLWKSDPDMQLWYFTVRRWKNRWCPEVGFGFYGKDEAEDSTEAIGPDKAKDVTPKPRISEKLKGNQGSGFNANHVNREVNAQEAKTDAPAAEPAAPRPCRKHRQRRDRRNR